LKRRNLIKKKPSLIVIDCSLHLHLTQRNSLKSKYLDLIYVNLLEIDNFKTLNCLSTNKTKIWIQHKRK